MNGLIKDKKKNTTYWDIMHPYNISMFCFLLDIVYNTFSDEKYLFQVDKSVKTGIFFIFKVCIG